MPRSWHIVRWFGFLAIGAVIAIGVGLRHRQETVAEESPALAAMPADPELAVGAPRPWLAPDAYVEPAFVGEAPPALAATDSPKATFQEETPGNEALDPDSPDAERAIDELGMALAGFDVENVLLRTVDRAGQRRFVFSCDVPTDRGSQTFAGEGPDPPSAARNALSRIRAWAAAPDSTTLR